MSAISFFPPATLPSHDADAVMHASIVERVNGYVPQIPAHQWAPVAEFVRAAVLDAEPTTRENAKRFLTALSQYVLWCHQSNGLDLDRQTLFQTSMVDAYLQADTRLKPSERTLRRAALSRLFDALSETSKRTEPAHPRTAPGNLHPYNPAELRTFRSRATGQSSERRRHNTLAPLALATGCGLTSDEIVAVRGRDVHVTGTHVDVEVTGRHPRVVTCLQGWENDVARVASAVGSNGTLFVSRSTSAPRTALKDFMVTTSGIEARPSFRRLRTTWIVTHLQAGTPIPTLMRAAGISSCETLDKYLPHLCPVMPEDERALLRLADGAHR